MFNENIPFIGRDENRDRSYAPAAAQPATENIGKAKIRVIGVGGAGNNAVNRMIEAGITSAEYIAVNTDAQILACNRAPHKIQIGAERTKGLGAGADPETGREAAEESKDALSNAIEGTDLLFITAGMGGGTGTGAAPVIAKIAKDKKILTVAVVMKPFEFEGKRRMDNAVKGIDNLRKYVDTLVIIPNEKISEVAPKNASMTDALRIADDVLAQGIRGIADLIVVPSLINLDFADVRTILKDKGMAHMGVGGAKGENRIIEAVRSAVNSPLLDTTIEGATSVIINVMGGPDLTLAEAKKAAELIHGVVDYSANIIFGTCIDEGIQDEIQVTIIATGFPSPEEIAAETAAPRQGYMPSAPQYATPSANGYNAPRSPYAAASHVSSPLYSAPAQTQQQSAQPMEQPSAPRAAQSEQPPYEERYEQPVKTVQAEEKEEIEERTSDKKLPPFVQRLLGKRK